MDRVGPTGKRRKWLPASKYRRAIRNMIELIEMDIAPLTTFQMVRTKDESGMSLANADNSDGIVLEGVVFSDGTVSLHWRSKLWSVVFYPDWETFVKVHIGSHPTNGTILRFYSPRNDGNGTWEWRQGSNKATVVGRDTVECGA